MASVKCSECGGQVSDKADACPKCGAKPESQLTVSGSTQATAAVSKSGLTVIHWIGIITAGGLVTLCSMVDRPGSGITSSKTVQSDVSSMAHIQCKDFVKARLKAPSSADFAFMDYQATKFPDHKYIIRASVEAQNSFGAKLKNNYVCTVQWNGRDDAAIANWTLLSLQIEE